jgi:hypothetical protein
MHVISLSNSTFGAYLELERGEVFDLQLLIHPLVSKLKFHIITPANGGETRCPKMVNISCSLTFMAPDEKS